MENNLMIYNPVSGKINEKENFLGEIITGLTDGGNLLSLYQTQGKGDAQTFISNYPIESYNKIICCGGDGTLHEVINGIAASNKQATIGYIPTGSTNDYAKNLGINSDNAINYIRKGYASPIDIGNFNGEHFNYVAAFGAFTTIPFTTSQKLKNSLGYFAYLLEGIKQLNNITSKHMRFQTDQTGAEDDFLVGMITNAFSIAGFKNVNTGGTQLNDGKMEYLFIKMPQNLIELQLIITALLNDHIDERFMYYGKFTWMELHSEPMEWTLDGENGGTHSSAQISVHSDIVKIITGTTLI